MARHFRRRLLKHIWSTDELRAIFNDRNRVQKWYDYEAALALEQAELGIIPRAAAQEIASKARADDVDLEAIGAEIRKITHPLVPALRALQARCKPEHGRVRPFRPHDAGRARHRDGAADEGRARDLPARPEGDREGALPPVGNASGDAHGRPHARRAGAAHDFRPQVRGLAVRNGPPPRAAAPVRAAGVRRRHGGRGRHPGFVRPAGARARPAPHEAARTGRRRHQLAAGARPLHRVRLHPRHAGRPRSARSATRSCSCSTPRSTSSTSPSARASWAPPRCRTSAIRRRWRGSRACRGPCATTWRSSWKAW